MNERLNAWDCAITARYEKKLPNYYTRMSDIVEIIVYRTCIGTDVKTGLEVGHESYYLETIYGKEENGHP